MSKVGSTLLFLTYACPTYDDFTDLHKHSAQPTLLLETAWSLAGIFGWLLVWHGTLQDRIIPACLKCSQGPQKCLDQLPTLVTSRIMTWGSRDTLPDWQLLLQGGAGVLWIPGLVCPLEFWTLQGISNSAWHLKQALSFSCCQLSQLTFSPLSCGYGKRFSSASYIFDDHGRVSSD